MWYLYILKCRNNSYYTGITTDIPTRIDKHNSGKGAKYTRTHRPVRLVYFEELETEREARKRESEIKSWRREMKERLVGGFPSERLSDVLRISGQ